jgi:hypothetical protein
MPLDRDHWPTIEQIRADLSMRFGLPPLPAEFDHWFEFARNALGMDILLESNDLDFGREGPIPLDGLEVTDGLSALSAMNGYRFILDQKNSLVDALRWTDQVDRGEWQPHWIVIESIEADPIIADVRFPQVPVLSDYHGSGRWDPSPMFDSLADFIATLRIEPRRNIAISPSPLYTVTIVDFGPEPKRVLLALKGLPGFCEYSNAALLALTKQQTLAVLEDTVSDLLAERMAKRFRDLGATVEIGTKR